MGSISCVRLMRTGFGNFDSQLGCTGVSYVLVLSSVEGAMRRCAGRSTSTSLTAAEKLARYGGGVR
jgi:hypothetical protein